MAATIFAVSTALNRFSVLFVADHTPDNEYHDTGQYGSYQNSSHISFPSFIYNPSAQLMDCLSLFLFYSCKGAHVNT